MRGSYDLCQRLYRPLPVAHMCQFLDFCISSPGAGFRLPRQRLKVEVSRIFGQLRGPGASRHVRLRIPRKGAGGKGWEPIWVMCRRGLRAHIRAIGLGVVAVVAASSLAAADTLEWALVQSYQNNPSLNAQRASLRATDENVPQALSGYRPKLSLTGNGGYELRQHAVATVNQSVFPNASPIPISPDDFGSRGFGATARRQLYNGFQTANRTRQAESQVMARAKPCASPSSRCCSTPRPLT